MRDSTVSALQMAVTQARDNVPGDATLLGIVHIKFYVQYIFIYII